MRSVIVLFGIGAFLVGCNSGTNPSTYDPQKPHGWVQDHCGDSIQVNWKYDPTYPGDKDHLIFDSVSVPVLRIRDYWASSDPSFTVSHSDTARVKTNVSIIMNGGRWKINTYREVLQGTGYQERYDVFGCFVYGNPKITEQPRSVTVDDGGATLFDVHASDGTRGYGRDRNSYTWLKNGVPVGNPSVFPYLLQFDAAYVDSGARFKVLVNNGWGAVTSGEAVLSVRPAAPRLERIAAYDTTRFFDSLYLTEAAAVYVNGRALLKASVRGSNLNYAWSYKGASIVQPLTSDSLVLTGLKRSDSGAVVRCVVSNTFGTDTAVYALPVAVPPPVLYEIQAGAQANITYGPLLDFDTLATQDGVPQSLAGPGQERFDLAVVFRGGTYKFMTPRMARKVGALTHASLDTNRLASLPMVRFDQGPTEPLPTEAALQVIYDQGPKLDSIHWDAMGWSFDSDIRKRVVLKTPHGRFVVLDRLTFNSITSWPPSSSGEVVIWYWRWVDPE